MSILALKREIRELQDLVRQVLWSLSDHPRPKGFGVVDPLDERYEGMAHFIKNRQHMASVPTGKNVTKQELHVLEDGAEILAWTEVAFDPATGEEQPPLPEFWAEVGKTVTREVRYTYQDGFVTAPFSENFQQEDNFTPDQPAPMDVGEADQIDEVEADVRPT
jgi:hypothetical protein